MPQFTVSPKTDMLIIHNNKHPDHDEFADQQQNTPQFDRVSQLSLNGININNGLNNAPAPPSPQRLNLYRSQNQPMSNLSNNNIFKQSENNDMQIEIHASPTSYAKLNDHLYPKLAASELSKGTDNGLPIMDDASKISQPGTSLSKPSKPPHPESEINHNKSILQNHVCAWSTCLVTAIAFPLLTWLIIHLISSKAPRTIEIRTIETVNITIDQNITLDQRFEQLTKIKEQIASTNSTHEKIKLYEALTVNYDNIVAELRDCNRSVKPQPSPRVDSESSEDSSESHPRPKRNDVGVNTDSVHTNVDGHSSSVRSSQHHDNFQASNRLQKCEADLEESKKWKRKYRQCKTQKEQLLSNVDLHCDSGKSQNR